MPTSSLRQPSRAPTRKVIAGAAVALAAAVAAQFGYEVPHEITAPASILLMYLIPPAERDLKPESA